MKFDEATNSITWNNAGGGRRSSISMLFGGGQNKGPPTISLDEIVEVRKGLQTDVFLKAGLVDPFCCFSIVTNDRTLDLVLENQIERDRALRGMKAILLNYPKVKFL